jgi:hypothetical protein
MIFGRVHKLNVKPKLKHAHTSIPRARFVYTNAIIAVMSNNSYDRRCGSRMLNHIGLFRE